MSRTSGAKIGAQEALSDLLQAWGGGDVEARDRLMALVYEELRRLAAHCLRDEGRAHSLQPTALVHEVYLRLVGGQPVAWQGRAHFFALCARMMRRILVDHARRRGSHKRAGGWTRVSLHEELVADGQREMDLLALDGALKDLSDLDEQQGRIVELRFFGGLSIDEAAEVLGVSPATVKRDWSMARAWLFRRLRDSGERGPAGQGSPAGV